MKTLSIGGTRIQVALDTGRVLLINDIGPWNSYKTVTNSAEFVVRALHQTGVLKSDRRLIYRDSEGQLGELLHDGPTFTGFGPATTEDLH